MLDVSQLDDGSAAGGKKLGLEVAGAKSVSAQVTADPQAIKALLTTKAQAINLLPAGIEPGTAKAKFWFAGVEKAAKAAKMYNGQPLIPGPGANQGDYELMKDGIKVKDGLSDDAATRVCGDIMKKLAAKNGAK
jgi:hypothetical protein